MSRVSIARQVYRGLTRLAPALVPGGSSAGRTMSARQAATGRWTAWANRERPAGPLLWVHGASVGELLAARPVVGRLHNQPTPPTVVYSYTSPSAARLSGLLPAVHHDFAPPDTPQDTASVIEALRPDGLIISRGDLWPELVIGAAQRGVPVAIIGGTVRRASRRFAPLAHTLYAEALAAVSWIGAVTEEDAGRWRHLGARADVVSVTGDPRHDQVLEQLTDGATLAPFHEWSSGRAVLVAGSVEPPDVEPLARAWRAVSAAWPEARLLVVPHDPAPDLVARLAAAAGDAGTPVDIWTPDAGGGPRAPCVIYAGVGALNDLYALAAIAFVGGGFRRGTLHAVIEPAAYAVPMITGPRTADFRDADTLMGAAGLVPIADGEDLARQWLAWLDDPATRAAAGLAARRCLTVGAAAATASELSRLLELRTPE